MHDLLARQLARYGLCAATPPDRDTWEAFVTRISATYADIDRERYVYERSMRIASREMEEMAARVTAWSQAVAAERDHLAAILGSLGDGVLVVRPDGIIESANPEAHQLLGSAAQSLPGSRLCDALTFEGVDGDVTGVGERGMRSIVDPSAAGLSAVMRVSTDAGAAFVADIAVRSLGDGDASAVVVVMRDITEVWRTHRERGALERLSRLVAEGAPVTQLATAVAEELSTLFGVPVAITSADHPHGLPTGQTWVDAPASPSTRVDIRVHDERWGQIVLATADASLDGARASLARFAELTALAVTNERARESLVVMATTDPLTGLHNQRAFHARLEVEREQATSHGTPLSLVLLDIDHFKRVNDMHGHPVGNEVLAEVAARLTRSARGDDCVARIGGEEFAWLMPRTPVRAAMEAAERARRAIREMPFETVGEVTASFGVCLLGGDHTTAELVAHADAALYWAKRFGRDAVFPYTPVLATLAGMDESHPPAPRDLLRACAIAHGGDDHVAHATRVATLAGALAGQLEWGDGDRQRVGEAALVHDLGGTGVPDLTRAVSAADRAWAGAHQRAAAATAARVLDDEQTAWVRDRHLRWDERARMGAVNGRPTGACIIAVADVFDTLSQADPDADAAVAACTGHAGGLLSPMVVAALPAALQRREAPRVTGRAA